MPNSLVILGLQGAGHLLSCGQRDRGCLGSDMGEVPPPVQKPQPCVCSGEGVSGEIGPVSSGRCVRVRVRLCLPGPGMGTGGVFQADSKSF